jgi:hypothetical protein
VEEKPFASLPECVSAARARSAKVDGKIVEEGHQNESMYTMEIDLANGHFQAQARQTIQNKTSLIVLETDKPDNNASSRIPLPPGFKLVEKRDFRSMESCKAEK